MRSGSTIDLWECDCSISASLQRSSLISWVLKKHALKNSMLRNKFEHLPFITPVLTWSEILHHWFKSFQRRKMFDGCASQRYEANRSESVWWTQCSIQTTSVVSIGGSWAHFGWPEHLTRQDVRLCKKYITSKKPRSSYTARARWNFNCSLKVKIS